MEYENEGVNPKLADFIDGTPYGESVVLVPKLKFRVQYLKSGADSIHRTEHLHIKLSKL